MRVAAIDCGTNSIRLLIAEATPGGELREIDRRLELNRLGQGVDATRRFADEALARTFAACEDFAQAIEAAGGADRVRFVATSAARDAANRDEFIAGVWQRLGVLPEVISGDEEAQLSYAGARLGIGQVPAPVLVTDLGGGSTECVLGDAAGAVVSAVSINMGSVRVRERFLDEVPTEDQIASARAWVDSQLDASGVKFARAASWIGVAGTCTSLSAIHQGLTSYDRVRVHGSRLTHADIAAITTRLFASTVDQICAQTPLQRRRAEVIAAGALVLERIAARVGRVLVVSESDVLDGIAAGLLGASSE